MSISMPAEILDSILSYLCGTASIAKCALVCQSWLPIARHHLLLPSRALYLNQFQIAEFVHLIDSPESTLSLVTINKLQLWQNAVVKPDPHDLPRADLTQGDEWMNEVAVQDLLARNLISFRSVKSLSLQAINWRTLSPSAVTSLHNNFTSVKELELKSISFTLPELRRLLAALTALEKVTIGTGVPFGPDPPTIDTVQISHPSLCHLVLKESSVSCMVQFFARAIQYISGITSIAIALDCNTEELEKCGELLETAGTSLRALILRVSKIDTPSPDTDIVYHKLLVFPHNTNLQEVDITPFEVSTIMPLLRGLKTKPNLSRLRLGVTWPSHLERWLQGPLVRDKPSTTVLKDPKLIVGLPMLHDFWDYLWHPHELLQAREKIYIERIFERLKKMLSQTLQYWTLEVQYESQTFVVGPFSNGRILEGPK
ncbi:hypothetical protein C0993_009385 [Termitomyces sp. T159_Od127]|nr:hypothetical protein C0993_009385 [Termitomyces sp. T159_Od127]